MIADLLVWFVVGWFVVAEAGVVYVCGIWVREKNGLPDSWKAVLAVLGLAITIQMGYCAAT